VPEMKNISTTYDPKLVEDKWYRFWEENHFFHDEVDPDKEPFSIVMPPPNVTGQLHMGHALDNTLQDIITRWRRMQGYSTLWLPGTDHAGIATQAKVEENLAKDGVSKYDLGREKFLEKVWEWKERYHYRITKQLRLLGSSCDWERERFTMDEGCSRAVQEVFVKLFEKGLIYRGSYIINWCPKCQTTISDIEVEHREKEGKLYYINYPIKDSTSYIPIATTRPETLLGDTAVAVNPEDERYRDFVGLTVILPLVNREIPIIADEYVDPSFGTGAVKITPAHDPNDFDMGLRHHLPQVTVIDKDAKMSADAGKYQGQDRYQCRQNVVADLEEAGLLIKIEEHPHNVGECYRCDTIIEPLISPQWFVKMKPLAEPAIKAVLDGEIRFVPGRFTKIYLGWLENIRDWCISRQLWWGHRIPVWYCQDCGEVICRKDVPASCPKCGSGNLEQDPDVLDTWFSSALWPFSTLGWPEKTKELSYFYPTSVLVTGRDIIFFWVARMIFMGLEFMEEEPFKEVFIHGLVLDSLGRKMSKSLGNGIDPLEIIDKYGADTLRFMLITGNTPGNDLRFQEERLEAARNFANKIWNASRFVMMNLTDYQSAASEINLNLADKWILERYRITILEVTRNLEKYELGEAARSLYEFIWNEFCDWYIELAKLRLYKETGVEKHTAQYVLTQVLGGIMQLLHPFMPYITEEIYHHLPERSGSVMRSNWPQANQMATFPEEREQMDLIMDVIRSIRNIRAEMNVPLGKKITIILLAGKKSEEILKTGQDYIQGLCQGEKIEFFGLDTKKPEQAAASVVQDVQIFLPLKDLIDFDKEISRLEKEIGNMDKELARLTGKLNNQGFLSKAPAEVVAKEKTKLDQYQSKKEALLERLAQLRG
jgi:valyl-tRNA synthetase